MSWIRKGLLAALVFTAGLIVGGSDEFGHRAHEAVENTAAKVLVAVSDERVDDVRMQLLMENPSLIRAIQGGGAFGNKSHRSIALGMFSRSEAGIAAARELIQIELVAPRTWLIRLPVSNAVLFETDEGLVLVETGVAAAGPALFDAVRSVSDAPLHTIIYTHAHVDHAYGTWAFLEAGERPEIVAHVAATKRFARYIRLRGSIAKYMNQPVNTMPLDRGDIAWPTRSFENRLDLEIGGESFVLQHHRAETDDQLYLWMPSRKVLVSSDYYQAWIPNAGNGKRVQRYVEEWAVALREMAGLGAELVLPGHGPVIEGSDEIRGDFILLAKALESIAAQTIAGLNAGLRKDEVWARVRLPAPLAADSRLQERYVSVQDISKMVIKQYTGWWDDIPSHW
ncbi:MAG: MBL fold metallo-hydrolase, partial [Myxococcota bacterium]